MSIMSKTLATVGEALEARAVRAEIVVAPRSREEIARKYERQHHPAWVYIAGLQSKHSRETMRARLKLITELRGATIDDFPWSALDFAEVQAIRSDLQAYCPPPDDDPLSFTTINLSLSAVRGVIRTAWRLDQMSGEQCMRACAVKNLKGEAPVPGRVMEDDEIQRLRAAFHAIPGHYGALLAGLLAVFVGAGLRREEVCLLPAAALAGRTLKVIGKGNKAREIPLGKEPAADLHRWTASRRAIGVEHGSLFTRVRLENGVETVRADQPISIDTMDRIIRQWARHGAPSDFPWIDENGEKNSPPTLTPHDLRRTFITRLLDNGMDVFIVQRLAGHASPRTTTRYDRRGQKAAEKAIDEKGVY